MCDIHVSAVTDAVEKPCTRANDSLEPDMPRTFDRALVTERSAAGRQLLEAVQDHAPVARSKTVPDRRDTVVGFLEKECASN